MGIMGFLRNKAGIIIVGVIGLSIVAFLVSDAIRLGSPFWNANSNQVGEIAGQKIDIQELGCDFMAFSAHKMFGPTGIGALYGKEDVLNSMPPFHGGGDMIDVVTFEKTTYNVLPYKFEAGTPNICGGIAFGAAIDYMNAIGFDAISKYEHELLEYATQKLLEIDGLKIYGTSKNKTSVISFNLEGIHPYDVGTILDKMGIAVRTGHHCAQPIMDYFNIPGTVRASFAFYNTKAEIDSLVNAIKKAQMMLA